jgi:transposase-like protein
LLAELGNALEETHGDVLREMLAETLATFMDAEANRLCGAAYGSRSSDRVNRRNGYRTRPLETRMGSLELRVPKLRQGSYLPSFVEPRRRWEKAFVNVVSEAYVQGVSTRSVESLVEAMGARGMSKSEVSRMASVLDEQVEEFRQRPLGERAMPYVWFDALYVKVREGGRVVSRAVLVAIGVNEDGEREVLGVSVAEKELESSWREFMRALVTRGLRGVQLAISDAHEGLRQAICAVFNGVSWQRCYVHFIRNVLDTVPKSAQGFVAAALRNVFQQTSLEHAREAMGKAITAMQEKWPKAASVAENAEDDVLAYFAFPQAHWRQIRSTNPLERLNKELRRRVRVVGIFPTRASVLRLVGMLLVEQDDEWKVGTRRYFSASSMAALMASSSLTLEDRDAA